MLRPLVGARFQGLFTPLVGVLFTFPSRYSFAIGLPGVFSLGGWCRRIRTGFLRPRPTQVPATSLQLTRTGVSPSAPRLPSRFRFASASDHAGPTTPGHLRTRVWARPLSLATTRGITKLFSLPPGTEMFQFPGLAPARTRARRRPSPADGLPHSEIRGSKVARTSPRLIAARHVLPRLRQPRHPPCALLTLPSS